MTAIRRKLRGLAGQEPPPHLDEHLHRVPDIYAEPAWNDLGDDRWKTSADLHKPV
jgi:hypothetical protein